MSLRETGNSPASATWSMATDQWMHRHAVIKTDTRWTVPYILIVTLHRLQCWLKYTCLLLNTPFLSTHFWCHYTYSTSTAMLIYAIAYLLLQRLAGATLLVFSNKQDLPGALSAKDIREVIVWELRGHVVFYSNWLEKNFCFVTTAIRICKVKVSKHHGVVQCLKLIEVKLNQASIL